MSVSSISPITLQAYRETEYHVDAAPPFILLVDCFSAPLARLHTHHGVACSAYITACNPWGKAVNAGLNARRQQQLADDLRARGLACYSGDGVHTSGSWPGEPSFLIMGLNEERARALGNEYEQNAVLCCGPQAIPRLVLLR